MKFYHLFLNIGLYIIFILFLLSCDKEKDETPKIFLEIEVSKLPNRIIFQLGEEPDFTGLVVSEVYTDGSRVATEEYETSYSINILKKGTTQVTVSARGRKTTFNISIDGDLLDTGIPVVYISTENNAQINSKETYVNANMVIKKDGVVLSENTLRIKGRGNATWTYEKKPYRLKLDSKANILNMGDDKDWVLLANYCDKTLLRTGIAFYLSKLMNFPWTVKGEFVELVLNGEYLGNYQLVEQIKQGSKRVDIPESGYLFEKDGYYLEEPNYFVSSMGHGYSFKNPDPEEDLTTIQWEYIKNYIDEFETVLNSDDYQDPENGYARYIDVHSFIRWFIFQNILANMDTNVYLTKNDMGESKIEMYPVWDFEWSIGIGWYDGERPRPANYYVWNGNAFYFERLLQDPHFKSKIKEMWQTISVTEEILKYIDETSQFLRSSQELNFKRWNIMDVRISVGGIPMGTYEKEVECDRQFFINHMNWLSEEFSNY